MEAFLVILKRTPIWTVIGPFQKGDLLTGNLSRKGLPIEGGFQVGGRWQPPAKLHLQGAGAAEKPRISIQHPGCAASRLPLLQGHCQEPAGKQPARGGEI